MALVELPSASSSGVAVVDASTLLAVRYLESSITFSASVSGNATLSTGGLAATVAASAATSADVSPAPALGAGITTLSDVSGNLTRYRESTGESIGLAEASAAISRRSGLTSSAAGSATTSALLGAQIDLTASVSMSPAIMAIAESGGVSAQDIYVQITGTPTFNNDADVVTGDPGTWTLPVTLRRGGTTGTRIPNGTGIVKWGEYSATPTADFTGGIILTSDLTYAPYIDVFTVAKNISDTTFPWDDAALKPRVRMGNLHGVLGNSTDKWGIAMSTDLSSTSNPYIEVSNTGLVVSDADVTLINGDFYAGNSGETSYMKWVTGTSTLEVKGTIKADAGSIDGVLSIGTSGGIYQGTGSFATPTTGLKIWNDSGVGRMATYNSGSEQVSFGTDGKLYAGGGSVTLDSTGVTIASASSGGVSNSMLHMGNADIMSWYFWDAGFGYSEGMYIGYDSWTNTPTITLNASVTTAANHLSVTNNLYVTNSIFSSLAVGARAHKITSGQSLSTGVSTPISFNSEVYDTDGIWEGVTNPTRFTVQHAGYYLAGGAISMPTGTTSVFRFSLTIAKNDSTHVASSSISTGLNVIYYLNAVSGMVWMDVGDYFTFLAFQDSGSTKTLSVVGSPHNCVGWIARVA